jgi:type I restriction enzyme R subunit
MFTPCDEGLPAAFCDDMVVAVRIALEVPVAGRLLVGNGKLKVLRTTADAGGLAEYAQSLKQARDYLSGMGFDLGGLIAAKGFMKQELLLTAVNLLSENTERRKTYQVIVEDVQARYRALFPNPGLFAHDIEEGAIAAIYNKLQEARAAPDVSALLQSLYDVVDTALTTDGGSTSPGIKQPPARYDLSRIDFARLRAEFDKTAHKSVVMLNFQEKLEQRLAAMVAVNPSRVDLYGIRPANPS